MPTKPLCSCTTLSADHQSPPGHVGKKWLMLLIVVVATSLTACGVTDQGIGRSVLLAAPGAALVGLGLQRLYFQLWKRHYPDLTMTWLPSFVIGLLLFVIVMQLDDPILTGIGSILLSPAYLPIHLLTIRILLRFRRHYAFTWGLAISVILFFWPAVPMASGMLLESPLGKIAGNLWMWGSIPYLLLIGSPREGSIEAVSLFGVILLPALVVFIMILEPLLKTMRNTQSPRNERV